MMKSLVHSCLSSLPFYECVCYILGIIKSYAQSSQIFYSEYMLYVNNLGVLSLIIEMLINDREYTVCNHRKVEFYLK